MDAEQLLHDLSLAEDNNKLLETELAAVIKERDEWKHEFKAAYKIGTDALAAMTKDVERYRMLRRGQHWSVINGIGDILRGDELDAAIDEVMK